MIIGENFPGFRTIPKLPESVRKWSLLLSRKKSQSWVWPKKWHFNVGNLSAGLILHLDYSVRQQMLAVHEVNFIPTVSSLASIPLQDLKDFMAKAGDVAYTSVQRPKAGEG